MKKLFAVLFLELSAWLAVAPSAHAHSQSQIFFDSSGTDQGGFGPNSIITISGNLTFHGRRDADKPPGAVDDIFSTAADIYVVPHGWFRGGSAAGLPLEDINNVPNTIIAPGGGSSFIEQVIGTTMPQGGIPSGNYDIVIDEHQNGTFESLHDFYLGIGAPAFSVNVPFDAPSLPGSGIAAMKLKATQQYQHAAGLNEAFKVIQNIMEPAQRILEGATKLGEGSANATDFSVNYAQLLEESTVFIYAFFIKLRNDNCAICKQADDFMQLPFKAAETMLENKMKQQIGLAADPADADFARLITLGPLISASPSNMDPLNRKIAAVTVGWQVEAELSRALLRALEKHQGAQEAKDGYWALAHAREIKMFAALLATQLESNRRLTADLRDAAANYPIDLDAVSAALIGIQNRLRGSGFSVAELKQLRGLGISDAELETLRQTILGQNLKFARSSFLQQLDQQQGVDQEAGAAYASLAAQMDDVIAAISGDRTVDKSQPIVRLDNAPVVNGNSISVSATNTVDPQKLELTFAWDLDGDGQFNDAVGPIVAAALPANSSGVIGLKVTNGGDREAIAYALINLADQNRPPILQELQPQFGNAIVKVDSVQQFHAAATDPDGDNVSLEWNLDGAIVGNGASFSYSPAGPDVGLHVLKVRATDAHGAATSHVWLVGVIRELRFVDLSIQITDTPDPVQVGRDLTYSIAIQNNGPDAASNVTVTNTLPDGVTFVSAESSQGSAGVAGNQIIASLGTLQSNAVVTIKILVNPKTPGTLADQVGVTAAETELNPTDNSVVEETRVNAVNPAIADLKVNLAASLASVTVSNELTYTITVKNAGPNDATGVVLTQKLPPSALVVSSDPPVSSRTADSLLFNLGQLPASPTDARSITVVIQPTEIGALTSRATATANETDPDLGNNQAGFTTEVQKPSSSRADLILGLAASTNVVAAGDKLTYTLTLTNRGPDTATGASVSDKLPAGVTFVSGSTSQGTVVASGGIVTAQLGALANGATAQVQVVVQTLFPGPLPSQATVAAGTVDPDPSSNSATVSVTVGNPGNGSATIAIVRNFDDPEITKLQVYLAEMGLISQVFDQDGLTFDALKNFRAIVWDDLSYASGGLTANDVNVFQTAAQAGIPLYFIGDDLALSATYSLSGTPQADTWVNLIHLKATDQNFGGNRTVTILNGEHPVINGPFGLVGDSNYTLDPDATTRTGTGEVLLASSGGHDVLVAYREPQTGRKSVTQNVLTYNATDAAGIAEKKKLFKNAVTWLLAKDPVSNLALFSAVRPDPATVGNAVTIQLTVRNNGPDEAPQVVLTNVLPAGMTFVSATPPPSSQDGNRLVFKLGNLASANNAAAPVTIVAKATSPGTLINTAQVSSSGIESDPSNDTIAQSFTVRELPAHFADIAISQAGSSNIVTAGEQFTYTMIVTNAGPDAANDVMLVDAIPRGSILVGISPNQGSANRVEESIVANLGTIASGATAQLTFTVQTAEPGTILNYATVSASEGDLNPANNSSALETAVLIPSGGANEVVSYQAPGWRYKVIGSGETPTAGFEQPDFDDSSFLTGQAAFGNRGGCPLQATVRTTWPASTRLLVRRTLSLACPVGGLHIFVSVDNDVEAVFFNGIRLQTGNAHEGCPSQDNFRFDVPRDLIRPGSNLVAYQLLDRGGETFFDSRILADVPIRGFDAAGDFSITENPHGAWTYGYTATRGAEFHLMEVKRTDDPNLEIWSGTSSGPHIIHNRSGLTQSYVTITQPPLVLNLDPSFDGRNAVVRWTAPAAGAYQVEGRFEALDNTTTDPAILQNSTNTLFSADITSANRRADFSFGVTVAAGDTIDFSVGQGTSGSLFDSTGLSVNIRPGWQVAVDAKANIFASGHATPPAPGGGGAGLFPPSVRFAAAPGQFLRFSRVTGTVSPGPGQNGPDGGPNASGTTDIESLNGISGIVHNGKTMFLVGVFLDDAEPKDPAPARLDFTQNGDYAALSPLIGQTFFIGDGLTGEGSGRNQIIHVPSAATRLFLGFADAQDFGNPKSPPGFYDDNSGSLKAEFSITSDGSLDLVPDISISGETSPAGLREGSPFELKLTVSNSGVESASGVTVSDRLPEGMSLLSASSSQGTLITSNDGMTAQLGTIASGANATVTLRLLPSRAGLFVNEAGAGALECEADSSNNQLFQPLTVVSSSADLAIVARPAPAQVRRGDFVSYELVVTNRGPDLAKGVSVVDSFTNGAVVSATASQGATKATAQQVAFELGTVEAGASVTLRITLQATAAGILANTAAVTSSSNDPDTSNNSVRQESSVPAAEAGADLSVNLRSSRDSLVAGEEIRLTVTVANAGPASATGIVLTETLPPQVTLLAGPAGSTNNNGTILLPVSDLAAGQAISFIFQARANAPGSLVARATVVSNQTDPAPANNAAEAAFAISAAAGPTPDLAVAITSSENPAKTGSPLTYTITVSNRGTVNATGVLVTNTLPEGSSFVSASTTQGNAAQNNGTIVATVGLLTAGSSVRLNVITVPTNAAVLISRVMAFGLEPDANPADNVAFNATTVTNTVVAPPKADLALGLAANPSVVTTGSHVTYSVTITNLGPAEATGLNITNRFSNDISIVSVPENSETTNRVIILRAARLAAGASTNLVFVVGASVAGNLTDSAAVSATEVDPDLTNNSASATVTVNPPEEEPPPSVAVEVVSGITFNPQTGLFEQTIQLRNPGGTATTGQRVLVHGLTITVRLYNAAGTTNGVPYVEHRAPVPPGTTDLLLEFFSTDRRAFTQPTYAIEPIGGTEPPAPAGVVVPVDRNVKLSNGRFMIEFAAIPGRAYAIQYSADLQNWKTAVPSVIAPATRVQWFDDGPPKTESKPTEVKARFYRVIQLP